MRASSLDTKRGQRRLRSEQGDGTVTVLVVALAGTARVLLRRLGGVEVWEGG
jgi:broad specificity phosphatase PhoE